MAGTTDEGCRELHRASSPECSQLESRSLLTFRAQWVKHRLGPISVDRHQGCMYVRYFIPFRRGGGGTSLSVVAEPLQAVQRQTHHSLSAVAHQQNSWIYRDPRSAFFQCTQSPFASRSSQSFSSKGCPQTLQLACHTHSYLRQPVQHVWRCSGRRPSLARAVCAIPPIFLRGMSEEGTRPSWGTATFPSTKWLRLYNASGSGAPFP